MENRAKALFLFMIEITEDQTVVTFNRRYKFRVNINNPRSRIKENLLYRIPGDWIKDKRVKISWTCMYLLSEVELDFILAHVPESEIKNILKATGTDKNTVCRKHPKGTHFVTIKFPEYVKASSPASLAIETFFKTMIDPKKSSNRLQRATKGGLGRFAPGSFYTDTPEADMFQLTMELSSYFKDEIKFIVKKVKEI